jgi:hypothetical protein
VANTTAGRIFLVLYDGTNNRLVPGSIMRVPNNTIDLDHPPWSYTWRGKVNLPSGSHILKIGTYNAENFQAIAQGGDYA